LYKFGIKCRDFALKEKNNHENNNAKILINARCGQSVFQLCLAASLNLKECVDFNLLLELLRE